MIDGEKKVAMCMRLHVHGKGKEMNLKRVKWCGLRGDELSG